MERNDFRALVFDAIITNTDNETANIKADLAADLREEMMSRIVEFDFIKKDGSTRHAHGTICHEFLPPAPESDGNPKKAPSAPNYSCFRYYDTEKQAWRAFSVVNLVSFEKGGEE
jgi:hypothetical protein